MIMTAFLNEAQVEIATVMFFQELGYGYLPGPHIASCERSSKRSSLSDVLLQSHFRDVVEIAFYDVFATNEPVVKAMGTSEFEALVAQFTWSAA